MKREVEKLERSACAIREVKEEIMLDSAMFAQQLADVNEYRALFLSKIDTAIETERNATNDTELFVYQGYALGVIHAAHSVGAITYQEYRQYSNTVSLIMQQWREV